MPKTRKRWIFNGLQSAIGPEISSSSSFPCLVFQNTIYSQFVSFWAIMMLFMRPHQIMQRQVSMTKNVENCSICRGGFNSLNVKIWNSVTGTAFKFALFTTFLLMNLQARDRFLCDIHFLIQVTNHYQHATGSNTVSFLSRRGKHVRL